MPPNQTSCVSFWKARLRSELLTERHIWAVLAHSGRVANPASKSLIATLGIVLMPRSTIRLIPPLDSVTPFKHTSTQAMNETSESLHCHLLPSSSSALPLLLPLSTSFFLPPLFIQRGFIPLQPPARPPAQPSDRLLEEKEFPFFREEESPNGRKGRESAQAGHETSSQPSRPPRPKPLNSQALQRAFSSAVNFCAGKD